MIAREVPLKWLTWPPAVVSVVAWCLGRLTHAGFFDLLAVAAGSWLGGYVLSAAAIRYLVRTNQLSSTGEDEPEL